MKFNICYLGPESIFNLRRDFILLLKYSLEDLGHDVILSGANLEPGRFNLIIGAYFQSPEQIARIATPGIQFAHINTEVISDDMLNFNPKKTDFLGSYLPSMQQGKFIWDAVIDNFDEHRRYGNNAHFLPWGWHQRHEEIDRKKEKDIDIYFFGSLSERRKKLLLEIGKAGITGAADNTCPYFLRNDRIARAKVQLNLIQEDIYTHVNAFRICYLANNACCTISENEKDPNNYLQYAEVAHADEMIERIRHFIAKNRWKVRGEKALEDFRKYPMNLLMEELLDKSFSS